MQKMKKTELILLFLLIAGAATAQGRRQRMVLHQVSNKEIVNEVFAEAIKVEEINDYWYKVLDAKEKTIGYAMTSRDYCNQIIGYCNATPVMIVTNKSFIIKKVALLSHYETPSYVQMLTNQGFFNSWNGKKIQKAADIKPDAYTGATKTAHAVTENVKYLSLNGSKKLPAKK